MTFTYVLGTEIAKVRRKIGDRTAPGRFSDEEITEELTVADGEVLLAAAALCDAAAAEAAPKFDFDALDQKSFKRSQEARAWEARAAALRREYDSTVGSKLTVQKVDRPDTQSREWVERAGRRPWDRCP